jgi:hypothetical protein
MITASLGAAAVSSSLLTRVQWAVAGSQRILDGLGGASATFAAGSLLSATLNAYLSTLLVAPSLSPGLEFNPSRQGFGGKAIG